MEKATSAVHIAATDPLPSFITPPGQSDFLLNFVIVFLILIVFASGVLYLRLHSLPEHIAHKTNKVQIQLVAVLGLIALFTHNQAFWVAALLLAMTDLPDFVSPITAMARSLESLAIRKSASALDREESQRNRENPAPTSPADEAGAPHKTAKPEASNTKEQEK